MHGTERSHQNDRKQNHESVHSWDLVLFLVKKNCSDMRSIRTSSLQKPQLNFLFFGCFSSYQKCSVSSIYYILFYFLIFCRRSMTSLQVVRIIPSSSKCFWSRGSIMASISALRRSPDPDMSLKISEGCVQCMITMVNPGSSSSMVSIYFFV